PTRTERCLKINVDHTATVGLDRVRHAVDVDEYLGVADGDAREALPAANLADGLPRALILGRLGQEHAPEDAYPAGAAVAGVRNHDRAVTTLARATLPEPVEPVIEPCGPARLWGRGNRLGRRASSRHVLQSLRKWGASPSTRGPRSRRAGTANSGSWPNID